MGESSPPRRPTRESRRSRKSRKSRTKYVTVRAFEEYKAEAEERFAQLHAMMDEVERDFETLLAALERMAKAQRERKGVVKKPSSRKAAK
ncbi:hypothetical protein KIPB_008914 [Kipferlia bialata]|uniref:Uncharacterized protein n=1 Tax=Kipferlia bialata TaxID=797122 RepID=A0A391NNT4_9EUKA|nr:hypothetical protein KIPB_008914 [Kipferlia bialata]|eukprot:g8914.t1